MTIQLSIRTVWTLSIPFLHNETAMATKHILPSRLFLLPAKNVPLVAVIRRKPSKCFHIMLWNTLKNTLEHGSWFRGTLYPMRCDLSFDGNWMVYFAMTKPGIAWNGICHPPFLKTIAEDHQMDTAYGGGYWTDENTLMLNNWTPGMGNVPFQCEGFQTTSHPDCDLFVARLLRDGFTRVGNNFGYRRKDLYASRYRVERIGDDGWQLQPSKKHPNLIVKYAGYLDRGHTYRYSLIGADGILDDPVDAACWDSQGNLIFARHDVLYCYSLSDLKHGIPGAIHDLSQLAANGGKR